MVALALLRLSRRLPNSSSWQSIFCKGSITERLGLARSFGDNGHPEIKQDGAVAASAAGDDANRLYGFSRSNMYKDRLPGTVLPYDQHVFLCFGDPSNWPPIIETSPLPSFELPRLLAASLKAHTQHLPRKTRFNVCNGSAENIKAAKGDVLVFPSMIKFKNLGSDDVKGFVEEFIVEAREWQLDNVEALDGYHIFVCAHGSRDRRCGFCGPVLLERFEREIAFRVLGGFVHVRACSHVGGHKFAGNILIYGKDSTGKIKGHWYGYVTPSDVAVLLDKHVSKGQMVDRLWRGEMTCTEP